MNGDTVKETTENKQYSLKQDELKKPSGITGDTLKEQYHIIVLDMNHIRCYITMSKQKKGTMKTGYKIKSVSATLGKLSHKQIHEAFLSGITRHSSAGIHKIYPETACRMYLFFNPAAFYLPFHCHTGAAHE